MNADYLWDRSGPVDEHIADLERVLAGHAFTGRVPAELMREPRRLPWRDRAIIAAGVLLVLASLTRYWIVRTPLVPRAPISWTIASSTGTYTAETPGPTKSPGGHETGQWVETSAGASVRLEALSGGIVTLNADTRALMVDMGNTTQRLELAHGSIYTEPSKSDTPIEVVTPVGIATIAPGTACLITYDKLKNGSVEVKRGRIEFRTQGPDTQVTRFGAGSTATIAFGRLYTPRRGDASPELIAALTAYESPPPPGAHRLGWTDIPPSVLQAAGTADEITLWNLMHRTDEDGRKRIIGRARELTKSMWKLDNDALLRLDDGAMETWWQMLESR